MPMPTPTPNPVPTEYPGFCPGIGDSTDRYCQETYSCAEGVYTVSCTLSPAGMLHNCSCYWPDGSAQGFSVYQGRSPCSQAAEMCGFRPPILK
jgi:hypothetical protein